MTRDVLPVVPGIDLDFRPKSYFWPLGLETHLLSRIKGAERKSALQALIAAGRLDDIPDFLAQSGLSDSERAALGRIHPSFMGGEYLPDLLENEVMVARITIASTTQDVTCVYAQRCPDGIEYRVVDEYGGDTLQGDTTRTSKLPLTLGELEVFFSEAWPLMDVLASNFEDDGYDLDSMQRFVISVDSQFYPQFSSLYRARIMALAVAHQVPTNAAVISEIPEPGGAESSSATNRLRSEFPIVAAALEGMVNEVVGEMQTAGGLAGHTATTHRRDQLWPRAVALFLEKSRLPTKQELKVGVTP